MIHRVVFGSIERFIGILIEHFAGAFPTWLAPVQVKVLPISDKYADYAKTVLEELDEAGIRAEIDTRSEKIGYKIREAQTQKIPYMLVVGQKEEEEGTVSVRSRFAGDEGSDSTAGFIEKIKKEIAGKEICKPGQKRKSRDSRKRIISIYITHTTPVSGRLRISVFIKDKIKKQEESTMTKLDCNVTGCLHNSENCCCKNVIVVEGQTAREKV